MAPLIVMNEPLVTRVVNDLVAQCRVPSFGPRRAAPVRLAETNEAREKRSDPQRARTGSGQKTGASVSQFIRYGFMKGLPRFGDSVDPECECSRFEQCGDGFVEARRFHRSKSMNSASLLGSGTGQAAGGKNLRRPVFQRRPSDRRRRGANRPWCAPTSSRLALCGDPCRRSTSGHRTSPRLLPWRNSVR